MKKMFLLVMLLTASMSFAQLKKVQTTPSESIGKAQQFGAPLEAEITKSGNKYTVKFRDQQFKTLDEYREFSFEDVDNTFNDLYAAVEEGFTTMPKESVMLELPDYIVGLHFSKFLGAPVLRFSCATKVKDAPVYFSNEIAKKQVDKLFGKKK
ncbi:hypothetical protein [Flavobacterium suzhouense]|uniref:Uncharacterized protein n=1 Tax=Flavobacterium suzhouense TaxID=1529638 RepID=A0ABW5P0P1_9FLAO